MSGQDARDVIAAHERVHGMRLATCKCGWEEPIRGRDVTVLHAAHQLDALTDAGYAIVRLPERDMTSEHATPESQHEVPLWALGDGLVAVVSTCCGELSVTGGDYQPDEWRTLAAAILAAAAHAEAGESDE